MGIFPSREQSSHYKVADSCSFWVRLVWIRHRGLLWAPWSSGWEAVEAFLLRTRTSCIVSQIWAGFVALSGFPFQTMFTCWCGSQPLLRILTSLSVEDCIAGKSYPLSWQHARMHTRMCVFVCVWEKKRDRELTLYICMKQFNRFLNVHSSSWETQSISVPCSYALSFHPCPSRLHILVFKDNVNCWMCQGS